ncbi:MAG: hypothetical protein IH623_05305 [Verrucomicrobia bacterium]|nr:hypothetical protein [Verrucomicrobiota bacterium]
MRKEETKRSQKDISPGYWRIRRCPCGQFWTEDGPFANETVTNSYTYRMRAGLALQPPTGDMDK